MDKKANNTEPDNKEQGFVPVQYKILKLSAKTIIESPIKEVKKSKGTGTIKYFQVPEYDLMDLLTMTQGNDSLISIGDSILLQKIREAVNPDISFSENGDVITPNEQQYAAYLKLKELQHNIKKLKRDINGNPDHKLIKKLEDAIMKKEKFLFVPYIINVESNKTSFNKFAAKGFYYGEHKYVMRSAGAGNLKANTVTFIREDYAKTVKDKIRPGFQVNPEDNAILPPTKFGAYEGLSTTGVIYVKTPRVVVVPDFEYITFRDGNNEKHKVYFVQKNEDKTGCDIDIRPFFETKQEIDENGEVVYCSYLNSFDGMGLISPSFAKEWCEDLHIDWKASDPSAPSVPSAFNVRANGGVKGLLVTFPFVEYANEKGFKTLVDIRYKGMSEDEIEYTPIEEVDVILTESQWKYKKLYRYNFDCFNNHSEALWGVQRYSPKRDKDCVRQNYQLLTTSNINTDSDIEETISPTAQFLRLLAEGKPEHILYALMKDNEDTANEEDLEENIDCSVEDEDIDNTELSDVKSEDEEERENEVRSTTLNEALKRNHDLVRDCYVGNQIQKIVKSYMTKAKAGKLYPQGNSNYQFMISDPYALCQWAFNWYYWMDENGDIDDSHKHMTQNVSRRAEADGIGLVPANCVYSQYWKKKNVSKIDACRSPMTDIAENNILTVCNENNIPHTGINKDIYDEMERYYKYIYSGIIYSIHDLSTVIHSDSDFDSDMVCTFNSDVFIRNAWNVYPTTYYKGVDNMQPAKYDAKAAVKADLQGFGNQVGVYSNNSTSLFAMMPLFNVDDSKAEFEDENGNFPYTRHKDEKYPEHNCSVGQLELYKAIKKDRYLIGEEIDSTKTGVKPKLEEFSEFQFSKWKDSRDEIRRYDQSEINRFAGQLQMQNLYKPKFMPYFFINVKASYKDKWTKYISQMRTICKFYTFESIDKFMKDILHGERKLETEDEKFFWEYFKSHSPLLLTDCLMNKICWKLEIVEDELKELFKNWQTNQILWTYAKEVEVSPNMEKFIKGEYEKYKKELMQIFSKKNNQATEEKTSLYKVGKRDALIFKIRLELMRELKMGWNDIFNVLVAVLSKYPKSKHNAINGFIWNIMGDDILEVIPPNPREIKWGESTDETAIDILGKKIRFWEEDREETDDTK